MDTRARLTQLAALLLVAVVGGALPTTPTPARFKLVIGNKAYSSWSLRAWLALHHAVGVKGFKECCVELAGAGSDANKLALIEHSPTGKVPALDDFLLDVTVWDSLAIAEHIAECYPAAELWPSDPRARAMARSVVAEMHSGFAALRSAMPMNVRRLQETRSSKGSTGSSSSFDSSSFDSSSFDSSSFEPAVLSDMARIMQIWEGCRKEHGRGGPFLFGKFSIADCMYAPVVMRFRRFAPPLSPVASAYCDAIEAWPAMAEWVAAAKEESARIEQYEAS